VVKTKSHYDSPLGGITLITDETALLGLWFDWQPGYADDDSAVLGDSPTIGAAKRWLDEYFAGCIPRTEVPLRLEGTPFRKEAWALLRKVPYGETVSYGGLARRLELKRADGRRVSARAIGGAVHHNPIALIVPCHRVVGADGSLTGYAGGIETKIRLLQLEGVLKQTERTDVDCESIDRIWRSPR